MKQVNRVSLTSSQDTSSRPPPDFSNPTEGEEYPKRKSPQPTLAKTVKSHPGRPNHEKNQPQTTLHLQWGLTCLYRQCPTSPPLVNYSLSTVTPSIKHGTFNCSVPEHGPSYRTRVRQKAGVNNVDASRFARTPGINPGTSWVTRQDLYPIGCDLGLPTTAKENLRTHHNPPPLPEQRRIN